MAVQRSGNVIFLDAPGTYTDVFPQGSVVFLSTARLISGAAALASLELFADNAAATAARKVAHLETPTPGAAQKLTDECDLSGGHMSTDGLTAVLTGAGAIAFIYVMEH